MNHEPSLCNDSKPLPGGGVTIGAAAADGLYQCGEKLKLVEEQIPGGTDRAIELYNSMTKEQKDALRHSILDGAITGGR